MAEPKRRDHRPWGYYDVLADDPNHKVKVKEIVVEPGQRLSLQRHRHRAEHWYVVRGQAIATRGQDELSLGTGAALDIPLGTWHRLKNPGNEPLVLIEIATGDYLGEDDIERADDDYGRA